jgi:hypothetical protein
MLRSMGVCRRVTSSDRATCRPSAVRDVDRLEPLQPGPQRQGRLQDDVHVFLFQGLMQQTGLVPRKGRLQRLGDVGHADAVQGGFSWSTSIW